MHVVNTWWNDLPGERYWLAITASCGGEGVLAVPRKRGRGSSSKAHGLISHVRAGDAIFHYDGAQQAIVACSTARGRVHDRLLTWEADTRRAGVASLVPGPAAVWAIDLERATPLDRHVPIDEIACAHSALFPALRAFEDEVGDPLYYPFAMCGASGSFVLPGRVFKLPALFVRSFPELAQAGGRFQWSAGARTHATSLPGAPRDRAANTAGPGSAVAVARRGA